MYRTLDRCTLAYNVAGSGGGAIWSQLTRCRLLGNRGTSGGGGTCSSTLDQCWIEDNVAGDTGGGARYGSLRNCALVRNRGGRGGGVWGSVLTNCTVVASKGGGAQSATLYNCILWGNEDYNHYWENCTLRYTCSQPLAAGDGNISGDPLFLGDSVHLTAASPCRGTGSAAYAGGVDVDGQPWTNPPSMGCDEWWPAPVILRDPIVLGSMSPGEARLSVGVSGQPPFLCTWTKDDCVLEDGARYGASQTTDLLIRGFGPSDAGQYQVLVSNSFGIATSRVARVQIHCVDAGSIAPVAPFTNWASAAAVIQDAITMAEPGSVILVTNGLYNQGGKAMEGDLTNRVALDKPVTVLSVNGPGVTVIEGAFAQPGGAGAEAVRCAWLTNGAALCGFTLRNGATRSLAGQYSISESLRDGGGVWCASTDPIVFNCIITSNVASHAGGGARSGTLQNCTLKANAAYLAGGAYGSTLESCFITANTPGGARSATLNACTVVANVGGGIDYSTARNCVLYFNQGAN